MEGDNKLSCDKPEAISNSRAIAYPVDLSEDTEKTVRSMSSNTSNESEPETENKVEQNLQVLFNRENNENNEFITELNDHKQAGKIEGGPHSDDSEQMIFRDEFFIAQKNIATNTPQEVEQTRTDTSTHADHYKGLYEECKRQVSEQEESIQQVKQKYDDLTIQYRNLEKSNTEVFESMTVNFENTINERNKQIQSLQKTIEDYDEKLRKLTSEHKSKVCEYEGRLNKDLPGKRINRSDKDKMFRFKERGRGSAKNLTINKCDNSACKSVNVDLKVLCLL